MATACLLPASPAYALAARGDGLQRNLAIEHPSGEMTVVVTLDTKGAVTAAAILRTARKLMDGVVFDGQD